MSKAKKPKKHSYEDLARIACELEARVIWALKFMRCPGAGMMVSRTKDGGFTGGVHWTHWFADGVEMLGRHQIIDRELLGLSRTAQNRILKQRSKAAQQNKRTHHA